MNLMEYQAHEIFDKYDIDVMKGVVIDNVDNLENEIKGLNYPLVVKAQVQVGGRGKAGGIQFAQNLDEVKEHSSNLIGSTLKGHKINKLMIVEMAKYEMELYLSIVLDRVTKKPMIIFSSRGGMDIEDTAISDPDSIVKLTIDPFVGVKLYDAIYLMNKSNIKVDITNNLYEILTKLYNMFTGSDAILVEINPLIVTDSLKLIALDGKINIDESALYRHKEFEQYPEGVDDNDLVYKAQLHRLLYIPIDKEGDIGVISNGSGMLMSTIDLLSNRNIKVASALDLGGGATADRIKEAIRIVFSESNVKYLYINIFGGITRCDEVANGIKNALGLINNKSQIIVRLEGTRKDKGIDIIKSIGNEVIYVDGLLEGVNEIVDRRLKS
ncbi:MAG: ADP-forming succinate--CoA ligase subunit beta [Bacillota bacterium]